MMRPSKIGRPKSEVGGTTQSRTKDVFRFLKNIEPAKTLVIQTHVGHPTALPEQIYSELERYWAKLENWTDPGQPAREDN